MNKFDRIIKENFREPTMWLLKKVGAARSVEPVPLLPKLQHTLEKEADMLLLLRCTDDEGDFISNVEWQASNDPKMLERMLLYYALVYHLYKLPVKSYVIYMGRHKLNMEREVKHPMLNFSYEIIDLSALDPQEFLSSDVPAELILAILAGRKMKGKYRSIIRKVLHKLHELLGANEVELSRKISQLEVLGELRNIQQLIIEEEQNMSWTYNLEKDIRYKQGVAMGVEKERNANKTTFVTNLIRSGKHTVEEMAALAEVSIEFILQIKNGLPSA